MADSLENLLAFAEGKSWIVGRAPAKDTICIRITEDDRKRLLRGLTPWWQFWRRSR